MQLKAALRAHADLVEAALDRYLCPDAGPAPLVEAMRYSLLGGGKRLRPFLVLAAAEFCGSPAEVALPAACAVEMVHTYSLIHDDLPCMDDDDLRRGRPTNHKVFGEALAVLAGDALLTMAVQVLCGAAADPRVGPERVVRALAELARGAGPAGMAGGQVLDLQWEERAAPPEVLERIHRLKTGALFTACLRMGAILGGGSDQELAALTAYSGHFGLAFQIQDDVLDVAGDAVKLGKSVGSDLRKDKSTYVKLYGLAGARSRARAEADLAVAALAPFGERGALLAELARYVVEREE